VAGLPDTRLRIVLLSAGDRIARLELLEFQSPRSGGLPPRLPALGTSHVALWTDDIHAFYELLTDAGVEAVSPPQTNGAVWAMHVLDPDGIRIELMQMRSEPNSN
jgi:catechol 2,3-dioxygenase-like lactoylglutathione lyase family enzyme